MEKFVEQTFLFDFYGELLTERQRQVYTSVVFEDYSLSEVAEELGISRQGVHDMIRRCNRTLEEYEEKLHLVEKFLNIRSQVIKIHELADKYHAEDIAAISNLYISRITTVTLHFDFNCFHDKSLLMIFLLNPQIHCCNENIIERVYKNREII